MIGPVKLHQKHQKQTKFCSARNLLKVLRDSIRKWRSYWKKYFLDKSVEEDEIKEEHVKLVPDRRKHEMLHVENKMCLQG